MLEPCTAKILALVERSAEGRIPKRRLQQTLWRFPAAAVNAALMALASRGLLRLEGSWVSLGVGLKHVDSEEQMRSLHHVTQADRSGDSSSSPEGPNQD